MLNTRITDGLKRLEGRLCIDGEMQALNMAAVRSTVCDSERKTLGQYTQLEAFAMGVLFTAANPSGRLAQVGPGAARAVTDVTGRIDDMVALEADIEAYVLKAWLMPAASEGQKTQD
jgi:hypothetical protein